MSDVQVQQRHIIGLCEALEYSGGTHSLADVLAQIASGQARIDWTDNAVVVSEIHETPQMRECRIWIAAGEMADVIELGNQVIERSKTEYGCTSAVLIGRRGWERTLKQEGWRFAGVVLRKDI